MLSTSPRLADEEDWLDLLVASERIGNLLDAIRGKRGSAQRQAMLQLAKDVERSETYAEEAVRAGVPRTLTHVLARSDDDAMVAAASSALAACAGAMAMSQQVREVSCGEHRVYIREGALGDGLGARIWIAAHVLCRDLLLEPSLVRGRSVLELGSGCGLCGILAARLGASEVYLTDYEDNVLSNLRVCVAGNVAASSAARCGLDATTAAAAAMRAESLSASPESTGREPEPGAASSSWDLIGRPAPRALCNKPQPLSQGSIRVRFLDWSEALSEPEVARLGREDACIGRPRRSKEPPGLAPGLAFPVIIASDVLYELYHAELLASILQRRLAPGGTARIALAVRRQAHLDSLLSEAAKRRLQASVATAQINCEDVGIVGRDHDYEGGFVVVTLTHSASAE